MARANWIMAVSSTWHSAEGRAHMTQQYASFLLRWWRRAGGELVEIERIQTSERLLFASLCDAFDWIAADGGDVPRGSRPAASATRPAPMWRQAASAD
jgi:hypothetical protein